MCEAFRELLPPLEGSLSAKFRDDFFVTRKNQRVDANRLSKPKPDRKIRIKHYRVGAAIAAHGLSLDDPPTWIAYNVSCSEISS